MILRLTDSSLYVILNQRSWRDDDSLLGRISIKQVYQTRSFGGIASNFEVPALDHDFGRSLTQIELGPGFSGHRNDDIGLAEILVRHCNKFCYGAANMQTGTCTVSKIESKETVCLAAFFWVDGATRK